MDAVAVSVTARQAHVFPRPLGILVTNARRVALLRTRVAYTVACRGIVRNVAVHAVVGWREASLSL